MPIVVVISFLIISWCINEFRLKKYVRYKYIQENQGSIDVKKACKLLGVSRSGYYAHINRFKSPRTIENEVLQEEIGAIFEENKGRYGSGKISKVLAERGIMCILCLQI